MLLAFLFFAISMMMAVDAKKQFSAATTGEVDLGVVGTLDTNSDVPELSSLDPVKDSEASDLPVIEPSADAVTNEAAESVNTAIDAASDEVSTMKDAVEEKAEEVKEAAVEEVEKATDPDKE